MPDTDIMPLRSELVALRRSLTRLEQQAGLQPSPLVVPTTGYRLVNAGDVVAADDHNMVMEQAMPTFATPAARDAAWTSPHNGAMCTTLDTYTLWRRISGAWRPWPDMGSYTGVTNASGNLVIPHRLGVVPLVVLCFVTASAGGVAATCTMQASTTTNFTIIVRTTAGAAVTNTNTVVSWLAYPPAP